MAKSLVFMRHPLLQQVMATGDDIARSLKESRGIASKPRDPIALQSHFEAKDVIRMLMSTALSNLP